MFRLLGELDALAAEGKLICQQPFENGSAAHALARVTRTMQIKEAIQQTQLRLIEVMGKLSAR